MTSPASSIHQPIHTLSSHPSIHRAATLDAIRQKNHDIGAKIEYMRLENQRMKELVAKAPGKGQSRIAWLAAQLNTKY